MEFTVWWEVGLVIRLPKGTTNNLITTVVSAIQEGLVLGELTCLGWEEKGAGTAKLRSKG